MCQFKSGVILYKHKKVLHDYLEQSHSELLSSNNIKDDCREAKFVRVEIVPRDGDVCNKDKDNWRLIIDQDYIPAWFDKEKAYNQMWRALNETWNNAFLVDVTIESLKDKNIYVMKNSIIHAMWGSSQVNEMMGSSQVNKMMGSSQVNKMWGSSQVNEMMGSSQVNEMWGSSQVNEMMDSSQVNEMWGSSLKIDKRNRIIYKASKSKYKLRTHKNKK
jgi:hypothetical protein